MRTDRRFTYVTLAALPFLLYLPALRGGFTWDEMNLLVGASSFLPFFELDFYRPLFSSIIAIERVLFGDSAVYFHMVNSILHSANTVLVLILARRLLQSETAAVASAFVFALHPVNSEAVAWVFAGSVLLKTFFVLISLNLYLMYKEDHRASALIASVLFYLLSCLCGQGAILFPLVILAYEMIMGDGLKGSRIPISAFSAAAIVYLVVFRGEGEIVSIASAPSVNLYNAFVSLGFYSLKLVVPTGLALIQPLPDEPYYIVLALAILALPFLVGRHWRTEKFLVLFVLAMLLPALLIVMSGTSHPIGLRHVYTAALGVALLAGHVLARIPQRSVLIALVVLVSVIYAVGSFQRVQVWSDRISVWYEASEGGQGSSLADINLAASLISAGRGDEAETALRKALSAPNISSSEFQLVLLLLFQASSYNDQEMYELLSEIKGPSKAYLGMGFHYFDRYSKSDPRDRSMLKKAIKYLGNSIEAEPDLVMARYYLGLSYVEDGEMGLAIEEFKAVEAMDTTGRYSSDAIYYMGIAQKLKEMSPGMVEVKPK